jgi:Spy/CpxP family protein refolding chaperone
MRGGRDDRFSDMTKNLNLTPEQSTKLAMLNENFKSNLQSLQQNSSLSKEEKKEQMKSLMQKHKSEMESLLTTEQKKQLKNSMKNRSIAPLSNHENLKKITLPLTKQAFWSAFLILLLQRYQYLLL